MNLEQHRYSLLLVSSAARFNCTLTAMLPGSLYSPVSIAADITGARRKLLEKRYDIIIVNTPLPDDFGTRFALDICENSGTGVLLLVKAEYYPDINAKVSPCGALTLSKPTTPQLIMQSLTLLCATRERLRRMEEKTASIEEKMENIRVINRAKCLLIEQLRMTESEAHRYLEKQAMDLCVTKRKIAENIISAYK